MSCKHAVRCTPLSWQTQHIYDVPTQWSGYALSHQYAQVYLDPYYDPYYVYVIYVAHSMSVTLLPRQKVSKSVTYVASHSM